MIATRVAREDPIIIAYAANPLLIGGIARLSAASEHAPVSVEPKRRVSKPAAFIFLIFDSIFVNKL